MKEKSVIITDCGFTYTWVCPECGIKHEDYDDSKEHYYCYKCLQKVKLVYPDLPKVREVI